MPGNHCSAQLGQDLLQRLAGFYHVVGQRPLVGIVHLQREGAALGLDPSRCYESFSDMAIREARKKDGIDAVAIVTPNHMHAPVAMQFLKQNPNAGLHRGRRFCKVRKEAGTSGTFWAARHKNALKSHHCVALVPLLWLETPVEGDGFQAALQSGSFE